MRDKKTLYFWIHYRGGAQKMATGRMLLFSELGQEYALSVALNRVLNAAGNRHSNPNAGNAVVFFDGQAFVSSINIPYRLRSIGDTSRSAQCAIRFGVGKPVSR
jgi:hypothetical protein